MRTILRSLTSIICCAMLVSCASPTAENMKVENMSYEQRKNVDSMNYVRQHKGEGLRRPLLGSEAELMDVAAKPFAASSGFTIVREPHAVLAKMNGYESSHAFYFYPSQTNGQTEVELLIYNSSLGPEFTPHISRGYFLNAFQNKYADLDLLINDLDAEINSNNETVAELTKGASTLLSDLDNPKTRAVYESSQKTIKSTHLAIESLNKRKNRVKQIKVEKITDARFQEALRSNQATPIKFVMPESARRFMVQAEDSVREKKFDDAANLYEQALNIAPLWPEGHFNRALVLGETGSYASAVSEMKRYLLLIPNASNARAAQDKIYVWERKAGDER